MKRYYSTHRPVGPGTYPRTGHTVLAIHNFDYRQPVADAGTEAWGFIEYEDSLTEKEMQQYELVEGGLKTWTAVTASVDDRGHIIAAITDTVRAVRKPESAYKELRGKDIYIDYYATREEAEAAVREARRENTP